MDTAESSRTVDGLSVDYQQNSADIKKAPRKYTVVLRISCAVHGIKGLISMVVIPKIRGMRPGSRIFDDNSVAFAGFHGFHPKFPRGGHSMASCHIYYVRYIL